MRSSSAAAPGPALRLWFTKNNVQVASGLRPRTAARLIARLLLLIALSLAPRPYALPKHSQATSEPSALVVPMAQTQSLPGASFEVDS